MFGLGFPEIIFILLLAAIILGPEHMPRAARAIGRWSAKIRSAATSFEQAIVDDEDLRNVKTDLQEIRSELKTGISEAKTELNGVSRELKGVHADTHSAFVDAQNELKSFQASTGRSVIPDNQRDSDTPEPEKSQNSAPSSFMSKPLGQMADAPDLWKSHSDIHQHTRSISLLPPRLLPGDISRLVSRKKIALDMPAETKVHGRVVLLDKPDVSAAWLKIRRLEAPKKAVPGTLRIVRLAEPSKK